MKCKISQDDSLEIDIEYRDRFDGKSCLILKMFVVTRLRSKWVVNFSFSFLSSNNVVFFRWFFPFYFSLSCFWRSIKSGADTSRDEFIEIFPPKRLERKTFFEIEPKRRLHRNDKGISKSDDKMSLWTLNRSTVCLFSVTFKHCSNDINLVSWRANLIMQSSECSKLNRFSFLDSLPSHQSSSIVSSKHMKCRFVFSKWFFASFNESGELTWGE